jgi:hypothetical protein
MLVNGAANAYGLRRTEPGVQSNQSAPVHHTILERAAEALYEFVFSGCDRFDGKHRWADCDEETKDGFRREASAVLDAVLPFLFLHEIKLRRIDRRANWSRIPRTFRRLAPSLRSTPRLP